MTRVSSVSASCTTTNPPKNTREDMSRVGAHLTIQNDFRHLIMQITEKIFTKSSLGSMKFEELKIIHMGCQTVFMRGILTLLTRECFWNTGNDDIRILNRNIPTSYWLEIHTLLEKFIPTTDPWIFSDVYAENTLQYLQKQNACVRLYQEYMLSKLGLYVPLPDFLREDVNILFHLGTVTQHRLFKTFMIFQKYWGIDSYEPIVRTIVRKTWFFFLILWGQLRVDSNVFCEQDFGHEAGILSYLQSDYLSFMGIGQLDISINKSSFPDVFSITDIKPLM
ncbi:protein U52 [Elephant endotheliotropic herpesvirus 1A]|uniref:Protein U52 n=3 Tax=Elephantid herpesvirus 1 TaxID=146015 RepID=E2IL11_ELHV1|nr:protein U52 [Elephant endotheliotropic herpesvirus 1A]WES72414.1 protein U52 [Elephantid betaherpesvirus 1]AGG16091.1 protein U52 [Elephant endotheliotropic herpesvirus 1A]QOE74717.1 protein U52 [Elephant endotheliotropic herpesvirus 1A]QOE74837.1 protein U52 [Elephant endotheliotropic herpesvirus 1A]